MSCRSVGGAQVRFGVPGWKDRYYEAKFDLGRHDAATRRYVARCYVEGLCWVLMYYYQGVQVHPASDRGCDPMSPNQAWGCDPMSPNQAWGIPL